MTWAISVFIVFIIAVYLDGAWKGGTKEITMTIVDRIKWRLFCIAYSKEAQIIKTIKASQDEIIRIFKELDEIRWEVIKKRAK